MRQTHLGFDLNPTAAKLVDGTDELPPLVAATTFPPRYNLHKYWGKKPGNIIAAYIRHYSKPGDTVLDLFAGSGIVPCEAAISHRKSISFDLNPTANLITSTLLNGPTPKDLEERGDAILKSLAELRTALFSITCDACQSPSELVSTSFEGEQPTRVVISCPRCGTREGKPSEKDLRHLGIGIPAAVPHPDAEIPNGWEMQKILRAGARRWSQLFTARNLTAVAAIRSQIEREHDARVRRALQVTFTAHLAQATRMIADFRGAAGGPSWKLNCYWLPRKWQELNPFRYFSNRLRKSSAALRDMREQLGRSLREGDDFRAFTAPASSASKMLKPGEVQYIFTDPPYGGEGIQYGELSMLWNLWLGTPMDLESEVAFNPYRGNNHATYSERLEASFFAAFATLETGGWMSVTFANKDTAIWNALTDACDNAGFELRSVVPVAQSASNITNKMTRGAPKTDLILNYQKPRKKRSRRQQMPAFKIESAVSEEAERLLALRDSFRTSDLYDRVLIRWLTFNSIVRKDEAGEPFSIYDIEHILSICPTVKPCTQCTKQDIEREWTRC